MFSKSCSFFSPERCCLKRHFATLGFKSASQHASQKCASFFVFNLEQQYSLKLKRATLCNTQKVTPVDPATGVALLSVLGTNQLRVFVPKYTRKLIVSTRVSLALKKKKRFYFIVPVNSLLVLYLYAGYRTCYKLVTC